MKSLSFTYVVVLQNEASEKITLVYYGTFSQVLRQVKSACPEDYFIKSISVA